MAHSKILNTEISLLFAVHDGFVTFSLGWMDAQEPNSMTNVSMDLMQIVNRVNHAIVSPCAIDRPANFDRPPIPDADFLWALWLALRQPFPEIIIWKNVFASFYQWLSHNEWI